MFICHLIIFTVFVQHSTNNKMMKSTISDADYVDVIGVGGGGVVVSSPLYIIDSRSSVNIFTLIFIVVL